jgi:general secretion pathway protein D
VNAPVINSRSADTVVVTPDGQTVVIGGLMQNSTVESESKIPVLGDIPLLGAAFKRKSKSNEKTELLIFLTPHVVQYPGQLAALAEDERSKAQIVPKSFTEKELDRFLDKVPARDNTPSSPPR